MCFRRFSFFLGLTFFLSAGPVFSQQQASVPLGSQDLLIEGDKVTYDRTYSDVDATGNVVISYQGTTLNAKVFKYSLTKRSVAIPGPFSVSREEQTVEAKNFKYDMNTNEGKADHLFSKIGRLSLKGEELIMEPDRWLLKRAEFTTCDQPTPHYKVQSKTMVIYPQYGFFVAFDNSVHTQFLPFSLWIPTYVYGNSAYSLLGASTPLPVIGSSQREGAFAKLKVPYFLSPRSTGTIDLGILGASGLMFGATHHLGLSQLELLELSLHTLGSDGWDGGVRYFLNLSLLEPVPPTFSSSSPSSSSSMGWMKTFFTKFNTLEQEPIKSMVLSLTWGELINDSRVDKKPYIELGLKKRPFFNTGFFTNVQLNAGVVGESDSRRVYTQKATISFNTEWIRDYPLMPNLSAQSSLVYDGRLYENADSWQRAWLKLGSQWNVFLKPRIWFVKRIGKYGASPFEFERKYAVEDDEIGINIAQRIGDLEASFESRYGLDQRNFVTAEVSLGLVNHCWKNFFKWNTLNGQFVLGIEVY
jgi:lipopolysaccharide export system protein LptA